MPRKTLPRIRVVQATEKPLTIHVHWASGSENLIDLSGVINTYKVFAPLRTDPGLFQQVQVGEHGTDIVWTDDIDMSNDMLWRLAQEQSGATMTAAPSPITKKAKSRSHAQSPWQRGLWNWPADSF